MSQDKFEQSKESHLENFNIDKSKKGSIDEILKPLINKINSSENFFTTSSCSGRIMLIIPSEIKKDTEWLFSSHNEADNSLIKKIHAFAENNKEQIWFKLEGFIMHIACRNMESAQKLLNLVKSIGLKRSGIVSTTTKIMVEVISSEQLQTPISKDNQLLVEDNYLEFLIDEANRKLKRTHNKIDVLFKIVGDLIK
jgi:tRNA wybutosine-synthesizing protein 3